MERQPRLLWEMQDRDLKRRRDPEWKEFPRQEAKAPRGTGLLVGTHRKPGRAYAEEPKG